MRNINIITVAGKTFVFVQFILYLWMLPLNCWIIEHVHLHMDFCFF